MNESAELLVGRKFQEVEGKKSKEAFYFRRELEEGIQYIHVTEQVLQKKKKFVFLQDMFLVQEKHKVPVDGTCSLIRDTKNNIIGTVTVFRDITKLRDIEQMKNSFLSVAAHQLRTPLGSMRWGMELLINGDLGKLSKDVKETIEQLYENSGRMVVLVNDLLNVSRIDGGKNWEKKQSIDLIENIDAVIHTMNAEAKKRSVEIVFKHPESIPFISAPPKHLYEAIENLVSNGIKYNRSKETLTITIEIKEKTILLKVADRGIGIAKEDQSKIFSKFFRASNAVHKETEGSGLGLSVVKSYIEECNATIRFESEENVGTTFFVEFPIVQ